VDKCCFRDCDAPPVASVTWGPICEGHSYRLAEGAQHWYSEAQRLERALKDCRERTAGLEEQVRQQRSAKNQARADLIKVSERLNAYTDRMITAGLMS
jgi:septal ring factor EnvC (AmiA/AmiB activator)